ncbi:Fic family protein [Candidatus Pacearchaeota archaeon]|nr:Fic family protein [Candidatus Pacearchaeota archaeon]
MSYIETKKTSSNNYISFVKKVSFMGDLLVIKKFIGLQFPTVNKEKFLLDNLDSISQEEFLFRKKYLNEVISFVSHNPTLPEEIELKSILLNNLLDAKNCEAKVDTEFAKEFIFNSNNIEGSKIPPEVVRDIIDRGDTKYADKNEVKEVKNSILAFDYLKKSFKFNLSSIKKLYHILTKDLEMQKGVFYPKGFKKISNIVGNSETTAPEHVEIALINLIQWYKKSKNKIHPLILAFEFHKRYEVIHPFLDGNGRTGRLIMNKILISSGYQPIIVYKENKAVYFNALAKASDGKAKNYYQFMLEQTKKTYDFLESVTKRY